MPSDKPLGGIGEPLAIRGRNESSPAVGFAAESVGDLAVTHRSPAGRRGRREVAVGLQLALRWY